MDTTKSKTTKKKVAKKKGGAKKKTAVKKKVPEKADSAGENMVTVQEIAKQAKVEAKDLRKALRSSNINKPGSSWRWPADHKDLKKVRELAGKL